MAPQKSTLTGPAYKLAGLALVLLLMGFLVWRLTAPPTDVWSYCARLVPGSERLEISFVPSENSAPTLKVGAGRVTDTKDVEVIKTLSDCIRERSGREPAIQWLVSISAEPLGQLANRWRSEPGLQVKLVTPDARSALILNNLKIGPTNKALTKSQLLDAWCSANAACVTCQPAQISEEAAEAEVGLRPKAPTEELVYQELAGAPKSDGTYEAWQYVKHDRKRYYFSCKGQ